MKLVAALNEHEPIKNILSSLTMDADEVFFLYHPDERKRMVSRVERVIHHYRDVKLTFIELVDDEKEIEELLLSCDNLIVDVSGALYISLVLFDKAIQHHKQIIYCDTTDMCIKSYQQHKILVSKFPHLSVKDVVELGGGTIKSNLHEMPDLSDKRVNKSICEIVEKTSQRYSEFTGYVQKVNKLLNNPIYDGVSYRIKESFADEILNDRMTELCTQVGLFYIKDDLLVFEDKRIAHLFEVCGSFLECYLYIKLMESGKFDEVMMSVVIDFSSSKKDNRQIICELDGLATKDNHSVFISCKSNKVETYAVNEIKLHSLMFGNELSHACLVTLDDLNVKSPSVYGKAQELEVAIVDKTSFNNGDVVEQIVSVLDGTYRYEEIGK